MTEPVETTAAEPQEGTETAETDWQLEARKWEKRAKENSAKLREAQPKIAEWEKLAKGSQTELEQLAEAKTAAELKAQTFATTAVKGSILALAAADFADPSDAVSALDPGQYIDDAGEVDTDSIKAELKKVLEAKPHWRRNPDPRLPLANRAQGAAGAQSAASPSEFMNNLIRASRG